MFIQIVLAYSYNIEVNYHSRSQRARWEHTDAQVDRDLFQLNVFSVINLARIVLRNMLERKSGHIAVMSSSAGKAGAPFSGSYTGKIIETLDESQSVAFCT